MASWEYNTGFLGALVPTRKRCEVAMHPPAAVTCYRSASCERTPKTVTAAPNPHLITTLRSTILRIFSKVDPRDWTKTFSSEESSMISPFLSFFLASFGFMIGAQNFNTRMLHILGWSTFLIQEFRIENRYSLAL